MGRKRPKTCDGRKHMYDPKNHCRKRKDLKRVTLVAGWGLPKEQQTVYQRFFCPECMSEVIDVKDGRKVS